MPFTRSNNKAVAAVQHLGQEVACTITQLGEYLKGLVTSQDPDWMGRIREWMRWILEKMWEFCHLMAWAVGCTLCSEAIGDDETALFCSLGSSLAYSSEMTEASSSAKGDILKALDMAMQRATILSYAEDLYGDDFMLGEELYEVLEDVKAKVLRFA